MTSLPASDEFCINLFVFSFTAGHSERRQCSEWRRTESREDVRRLGRRRFGKRQPPKEHAGVFLPFPTLARRELGGSQGLVLTCGQASHVADSLILPQSLMYCRPISVSLVYMALILVLKRHRCLSLMITCSVIYTYHSSCFSITTLPP